MKKNNPRRKGLGSESRPSSSARKLAQPGSEFSDAERALAVQLRQVYIADRSAWESMYRGESYQYVPSRLYDRGTVLSAHDLELGKKPKPSVWLTLARRFIALNIDPEEYIHTIFEKIDVQQRPPPEPNQLLTDSLIAYYRQSIEGDCEEIAMSLNIQRQIAAANISYKQRGRENDYIRSHVFVLCDENLDLSALFRYCLARSIEHEDIRFKKIARSYEREAAVQFERNRKEYKATWGSFLPEDFVKRARKIYEAALRRADLTGGSYGEEEE